MSLGKKGKKNKAKTVTVSLTDYLADTVGSMPSVPVKQTSWADDGDEDYSYSSRVNKEPVILPTAPRAARDPNSRMQGLVDEENIPTNPPFVAYITNLPYDVDEEDLAEFFAEMKVSNMRLPKDSNKLRGYGYVEFEDRQSLIDALSMTNTTIKTRRVRIEVSNSSNDERRGRMNRDNRRDNYEDSEQRTAGDWRSGPREEPSDRYRSRFDGRDKDGERDGSGEEKSGTWRDGSGEEKSGTWRDGSGEEKSGTWRDRGNDGDRGRSTFRERGGFRDDERERGWGSSQGDRDSGDRDRDRDRSGSSFGPRRNYESDWDYRRPARSAAPYDPPSVSSGSSGEQKTRPKLQLQPRTKRPESDEGSKDEPAAASAAPAPSATPSVNIFGAAKPVDTAAKEREIEERLAKTYAESRSKDEGDPERRQPKEGSWIRRNGEGRDDKEKGRWRSDDDRDKPIERSAPRNPPAPYRAEQRTDSRGPPSISRAPPAPVRAPPKPAETRPVERERREKEKDEDDISRMPKAKDEQTPNFVASNKYSMLPDDVDPDTLED